MEENQEIKNVSPADAVDTIRQGAEIYTQISSEFIQSFVFFEKTLYEWASEMMIKIPQAKDLDSLKFREVMVQLGRNTQIANNYYSAACSMEDTIQGGNSIRRSDVVKAIVDNYAKRGAKRPAATVIEQMADSYMSNTISAKVASKLVKNFWKQRLDMLLEVRKIMEQIGVSLHVEMKWTGQ